LFLFRDDQEQGHGLSHALGNTGTRISITLLKEMIRRKCKYGVSSACIGSGLGIAVVWENLTT